ncbi:MAG: hypothetical protein LBH01_09235 [Verrucomicrobiales bacterium]|jgi:hypothetical protein|nr:hypothetical protein [Verrucomicrobiales bacterium]
MVNIIACLPIFKYIRNRTPVMKIRAIGLVCLGMSLALPLQAGQYSADWRAFIKVVDEEYPFFDLKGIREDWRAAKPPLTKRAEACANDEEFLVVIRDALDCLRDGHAGFVKTRVPVPKQEAEFCLPLALMPADGKRVVVMSAPVGSPFHVGDEIRRIDGHPARNFLDTNGEALWRIGGAFSSPQRARLLAYRCPLRAREVTEHVLMIATANGEREIRLKNDRASQGWAHVYNMPPDLQRADGDCYYKKLKGGAGYLYVRRIQGDKTTRGIRSALESVPDAHGWIVDLRGNGGGGYDENLLQVVREIPRPVAVIVDAGCMSAGETLARDFRQLAKARIFGEKSAGASSAKRNWDFPGGIATVVLPTRSRSDDGKPIEFYGIEPDVEVEAVPEEVASGANSEILRAEEYLATRKY